MRSWRSEEKAEQCNLVNTLEINVKCQSFQKASVRQLGDAGTEGRIFLSKACMNDLTEVTSLCPPCLLFSPGDNLPLESTGLDNDINLITAGK